MLHRYSILKKLKVKDLPFVAGQGLMRGSEDLMPDDSIEPILKQGTWAIGFIGLAETLYALIGSHNGETDEARNLGLKIIKFIREYTDKLVEETQLNWSCYATPAEGLSGRFTKMDRRKFGTILGVTDRDYYTNSNHVPVWYKCTAEQKARATYEWLLNLTDDYEIRKILGFLREREVVHYQRFGEALMNVQDNVKSGNLNCR